MRATVCIFAWLVRLARMLVADSPCAQVASAICPEIGPTRRGDSPLSRAVKSHGQALFVIGRVFVASLGGAERSFCLFVVLFLSAGGYPPNFPPWLFGAGFLVVGRLVTAHWRNVASRGRPRPGCQANPELAGCLREPHEPNIYEVVRRASGPRAALALGIARLVMQQPPVGAHPYWRPATAAYSSMQARCSVPSAAPIVTWVDIAI